MKKKLLLVIAIIIASACGWLWLKPAATDKTQLTLYGNVDIQASLIWAFRCRDRSLKCILKKATPSSRAVWLPK